MIETAAADGCSITCGSRDYNMTNYEKIDAAIRRAEEGRMRKRNSIRSIR